MLVLVELLFWIFAFPYILFGVLLRHILSTISETFQPQIFMFGVWFAALGLHLHLIKPEPNERQFESLVETIAQSHIFGLATPLALSIIASLIFAAAALLKRHAQI